MIQISNNRTIRTGLAQSFAAAREHFDTRGYLKLAGLIEPGFLSQILEAIDRATFYERVHEGIGVELCAAPGAAAGALALACNDPALFELVAELQAGKLALNVPLVDGDTVTVPKAQSVFVTGQVKTPGAYAVERDTTVLQVLSLAGGLTDRGADSRIVLIDVGTIFRGPRQRIAVRRPRPPQ